jgi:hypothetical protein
MAINVLTPAISFPVTALVTYFALGDKAPWASSGDGEEPSTNLSSAGGEVEGPLMAATWAFNIWTPIYTLLVFNMIYQVLPSEWVPERSDEMIYVYMNLIPAINIFMNAAWFPFSLEGN